MTKTIPSSSSGLGSILTKAVTDRLALRINAGKWGDICSTTVCTWALGGVLGN